MRPPETRDRSRAPAATAGRTPERILRAATAIFAERGYDRTFIKDIAAAAGVNIAALNYHFESKELLYRRILERLGRPELTSAARALRPATSRESLRVRLDVFLTEAIANVQLEPDVFRIVLRETEKPTGGTAEVYLGILGDIFDALAKFLSAAKRARLLRPDLDVKFATGFLLNHLLASLRADEAEARQLGRTLRDPDHRARWVAATLDVFLDGAVCRRTPRSGKEPT